MKPICTTAQILSTPAWRKHIQGKYVIRTDTGCWEWTSSLDRHGYGRARIMMGGRKRLTGAHRASWIVHRGPISGNLTVDHLCRNKICINPFHMELVTNAENIRRAHRAGVYGVTPRPGAPRIPLEKRVACRRHGPTDGHWHTKKNGYTAWSCRPCNRNWYNAFKVRQAAKG